MRNLIVIIIAFIAYNINASAETYRVNVEYDLNVRASSSRNGKVVGKLYNGDEVNVISRDNGWACITYNGKNAYVKEEYLIEYSGYSGERKEKESGGFFSWLFNSEGESSLFTCIKWLFFIGLAMFIVKVGLQVLIRMLGCGLVSGGIAWLFGLLIEWFGWIDGKSLWDIVVWGFYIGTGIGLIYCIFHLSEILDDAASSSSSSSSGSSGNGGLKQYSVYVDGRDYTLTQNSIYSECDYTDQDGNSWERNGDSFYKK